MILITCLTTAWLVLFWDRSGPIASLDNIVYVMGILTMVPLIVNEKKWSVAVYSFLNVVMLSRIREIFQERFHSHKCRCR